MSGTTPTRRTFATRGTYWDGVQRHMHIHTDRSLIEVATDLLTGFLPYSKVEIVECESYLTCTHHTGGDFSGADTFTLEPATH